MNKRRSLTNIGGSIQLEGDRADAERLAYALDVPPSTDNDDDPARAHIHGFHTYPARMHPTTASRLVSAFTPAGGRVLDPFCGSGTVLVEALIAGRSAVGTDLNPIAVRLASSKLRPRKVEELASLVEAAKACTAYADERRQARASSHQRFSSEDIALYEPHVLRELDSLRAKVESFGDDPSRVDLELVLSSVLVKLSRKGGDTREQVGAKSTRPGFAAKMFSQKAQDLATRLESFARLLPSTAEPRRAVVIQDDATELKRVPPDPIDAIITSPPYAATYDYMAHHELRLRWLKIDATPLARGEIGSRSAYAKLRPSDAARTWGLELERFFRAAVRSLPRGGPLVVMMADSAVGDVALRADAIVAEAGRASGLNPWARASQVRPHFHGPTSRAFRDRPREEHALLLRRG